ncbi:MAG: hypothetical protein AAF518_09210 [Spirochaetota bacterium]
MDLYPTTLAIHNVFRWLVLAAIALVILRSFSGWIRKQNWNQKDETALKVSVIFAHIQLLLGLLLYFVLSPITLGAMKDFKAAMKKPDVRFYAAEHIFMMILGIFILQYCKIAAKRKLPNYKKQRFVFICYLLALVVIISKIPWHVRLLPF